MDLDNAPVDGMGANAPVDVITPAADTGDNLSIRQAAQALAAARHKPKEPAPVEQPNADPVEPEELAEANADPVEEPATSEDTKEQSDPAELPPIDPPRSWTKEAKERFESLPRETQEYLAAREQERDREVRRSQNEAAEQRKAVEAEREQIAKGRQDYEAKLAAALQLMQDTSPFADIKTMADVEKLQAEDPFRFQAYQVHQWKMQALNREHQQAEERKASETQTKWTDHVREESTKFAENLSEADKAKISQLTADAPKFLLDRGFTEQELAAYASGSDRLSIYDHRVQSLILDGMKYRDVQKARTAAVTKPLPPVQRPGTSRPAGAAASEQIQALERKATSSGALKDFQALRSAQLASRRPA